MDRPEPALERSSSLPRLGGDDRHRLASMQIAATTGTAVRIGEISGSGTQMSRENQAMDQPHFGHDLDDA
jgi:hypothetical protein